MSLSQALNQFAQNLGRYRSGFGLAAVGVSGCHFSARKNRGVPVVGWMP